jgi:hypothetical protein
MGNDILVTNFCFRSFKLFLFFNSFKTIEDYTIKRKLVKTVKTGWFQNDKVEFFSLLYLLITQQP